MRSKRKQKKHLRLYYERTSDQGKEKSDIAKTIKWQGGHNVSDLFVIRSRFPTLAAATAYHLTEKSKYLSPRVNGKRFYSHLSL